MSSLIIAIINVLMPVDFKSILMHMNYRKTILDVFRLI
jgi:hypothetical protein